MKIDWKRKLTSRKFWAAVAGFITGIIILCNSLDKSPEKIAAVIMSAGSLIGYIIGEGIADSGHGEAETTYHYEIEDEADGCTEDGCQIVYHDEEVM